MRILELIKKWTLIVVHSERGGGGGDSAPEAPRVTPQQTAAETLAAQQATNPQAAALEFGIQQQYMPQMAQLGAQSREIAQPGGGAVNQQLMDVIMQNLISPQGISPQQGAAQESIRGREVDRFQEAQRTRANLGGGLYGGRSAAAEERGVGQLSQQFAAEDIDRETQQRQYAQQAGLQLMAQYFGVPIQSLQYQSPAATGNTALSAGTAQRGQDVQFQQQQQASQAAMQSALYQTLGNVAASALTGFSNFKAAGATPPPVA